MARLVDARRLRRRPDIEAGEQVAEARMVLPEGYHRAQHVGPAQEGAVVGPRGAHDDMVAAAGADALAVDHELVGDQARHPRLVIDGVDDGLQLGPVFGRLDIDLDNAGVRRDRHGFDTMVARRTVAFDDDRRLHMGRHRLDGVDQAEIVLGIGQGRQEQEQLAVADLGAERRADKAIGQGRGLVLGRRRGEACAILADLFRNVRQRFGGRKG